MWICFCWFCWGFSVPPGSRYLFPFQIRKVLSYPLNKIFDLFFFLSSSGIPTIQMLGLMESLSSLSYSHFAWFSPCSAWLLSITLYSRSSICFSVSSILLFTPSSVFSPCLLGPLTLVYYSSSLLIVSLMSCTLFSSPASIFLIIGLNSPSVMLLMCVLLVSQVMALSVLSFGINSSVFAFYLSLRVCFSVLGMTATSPVLEGNGFTKKRSCRALQCIVPFPQSLALLGLSLMCAVYALLLCHGHSVLQASHLQWLS